MKIYDFDKVIDRSGTDCLKKDLLKERFGREDLIPLWVADMDFATPDFILNAIRKRCEHELLGYTFAGEEYYEAIRHWLKDKHHWPVDKTALGFLPGIVPGLAMCVNCFTVPGDKIIIQPPIYPPFISIPKHNDRVPVNNPLVLENGQFRMDFEQLESVCDEKTRMLLLCNPHNPGGKVWSKEDLIRLADICHKRNILVVSDEIHADLTFPGKTHIPFASVSEKAAMNSITLMAPSKTFNVPGVGASFYVAVNADIKEKFSCFLAKNELANGHIFAFTVTRAAYENGKDWLKQATDYIWKNVCFVDDYLKNNIPSIKAIIPEASYLVWLDCREWNKTQKELVSFFIDKARLALNDGTTFGEGGEGFMRLNVGTPRSILEKALKQLKEAV
ncbi:MAG: PatB family C-S lyase [Candidatus Azobacteroides sp.]|nr:PatB family C-S lyase [Candidatus Azobacteroides sp.]